MNKDHILSEIRRLASENGGTPLGKVRFFQETGIKESDWFGKHWNRWGDAVQEAGLTPNSLNQPLESDYLLRKLVQLIDQLGRFPVKGDLLMKAKEDQHFPSHNTFQRFGEKPDLAGAVIAYCKKVDGNSHVIDICTPISKLKRRRKATSEPSASGDRKTVGYVYLIQFGAEYKIGTSNNVERRFSQLKTQMPYEGKIIHTIETGDPTGIEAYWHKYFDSKRLRGEWFKLTAEDIKYFKKRRLM